MNTNQNDSTTNVDKLPVQKSAYVTCSVPDNFYFAGIKFRFQLIDPDKTIKSFTRTERLDSAEYNFRIPAFVKESDACSVELALTFEGITETISLLNEMRDYMLDANPDIDTDPDTDD